MGACVCLATVTTTTTVYVLEMSVNVVCACFAKRIPFSGPNIKYIRCLITTIRNEMPQKCALKQNTKTTMSMRNNKSLQFCVYHLVDCNDKIWKNEPTELNHLAFFGRHGLCRIDILQFYRFHTAIWPSWQIVSGIKSRQYQNPTTFWPIYHKRAKQFSTENSKLERKFLKSLEKCRTLKTSSRKRFNSTATQKYRVHINSKHYPRQPKQRRRKKQRNELVTLFAQFGLLRRKFCRNQFCW